MILDHGAPIGPTTRRRGVLVDAAARRVTDWEAPLTQSRWATTPIGSLLVPLAARYSELRHRTGDPAHHVLRTALGRLLFW